MCNYLPMSSSHDYMCVSGTVITGEGLQTGALVADSPHPVNQRTNGSLERRYS